MSSQIMEQRTKTIFFSFAILEKLLLSNQTGITICLKLDLMYP